MERGRNKNVKKKKTGRDSLGSNGKVERKGLTQFTRQPIHKGIVSDVSTKYFLLTSSIKLSNPVKRPDFAYTILRIIPSPAHCTTHLQSIQVQSDNVRRTYSYTMRKYD